MSLLATPIANLTSPLMKALAFTAERQEGGATCAVDYLYPGFKDRPMGPAAASLRI